MAQYSVSSRIAGNVSVEFGLDTKYGLTTWDAPVPQGGSVDILVAGMKATTTYHMRAVMKFSDGTQSADDDHTFTTGKVDPAQAPAITVTTSPGAKPQSGVELLQLVSGNSRPTVSDLSGNVLWTYDAVPNGSIPNPVALLPNDIS